MTTKESLSLLETSETNENDEEIEETTSPLSLGTLPDVVLQHLAPFLKWTSRRSLSQVNSRFRGHYAHLLKDGKALSIKGQVSVGVGDSLDGCQSVSYLSEFYTIRVEMDDDLYVNWTLKMESGVRTVVLTQYDGEVSTTTTRSVLASSRDYLEKILKWILANYQFKKIHLGVHGLTHLFESYNHKVDDVGVSDEVEYLALAEKLKPKKLALFPPTQNSRERGTLELKKFPQLEELRMYGVPLDLDQLIESKLLKVTADTINKNIMLKHAKKLIENWERGVLNYKKIQISSEPYRTPVRVPYSQWSELNNGQENVDAFYDHIKNNQQKTGSFRYSRNSFEFVSWEENGGIEPNMWSLHF